MHITISYSHLFCLFRFLLYSFFGFVWFFFFSLVRRHLCLVGAGAAVAIAANISCNLFRKCKCICVNNERINGGLCYAIRYDGTVTEYFVCIETKKKKKHTQHFREKTEGS